MQAFWLYWRVVPCVIFEDEHLLVVNKPAGLNTHAPSPYAGEGLYEWLRHREPRWEGLAIIHRLDKETSGLIVFAKSSVANRSLTEQFTARAVRKTYVLITDRRPARAEFTVKSRLKRAGERYASVGAGPPGEPAETCFKVLEREAPAGGVLVQARPLTGRTHQIRVHAAEHGFPILGDTLYGGTPGARMCLHAAEISFTHPATGTAVTFGSPTDFTSNPRLALRAAMVDPLETDAFRLVHGASDGWPGWYVDRLGAWLLSQGEQPLDDAQGAELERLARACGARGAYHKRLARHIRKTSPAESSPQWALGEPAPERFTVLENGIIYELSFTEGYSVGLFLDQRDNRRRLITGHVAAGFPLFPAGQASRPPLDEDRGNRREACPATLNTFAYTCGFSVCAAKAGIHATSLDLSKKYLEWGKRNLTLNAMSLADHDFIFGDVFDWLKRLGKKGRRFEVVLLDPPTFSQSKAHGSFRAEKDYSSLVSAALPMLNSGGILFTSTNAADWPPEEFLATVQRSIQQAARTVDRQHYVPQPPDFPVSRAEPAYLKTAWFRVT